MAGDERGPSGLPGRVLGELGGTRCVTANQLRHHAGRGLLAAAAGRDLRVWRLDDRGGATELFRAQRAHSDGIADLAFDGPGARLATASLDMCVRVWDVATGEVTHERRLTNWAQAVAWVASPAGPALAAGGFDERVTLWYPDDGRGGVWWPGWHGRTVRALLAHPSEPRLVAADDDQLTLWRAEGMEALGTAPLCSDQLAPLDARRLLCAAGGHVHVLDWATLAPLQRLPAAHAHCILAAPRGGVVATLAIAEYEAHLSRILLVRAEGGALGAVPARARRLPEPGFALVGPRAAALAIRADGVTRVELVALDPPADRRRRRRQVLRPCV